MGDLLALQLPVICVVGPTATGKTALAQALAEKFDGEVISADSMQIYRGMDIGTGKIAPEQRSVPYHGLDMCDPGTPYSAALFQDFARSCFAAADARGKRSILCGGTGLYVRAAIDDYDFPRGQQEGNPARDHYTQLAQEEGALALWQLLDQEDPASAALIHPNNTRRVIRAFELLAEGTNYASVHAGFSTMHQAVPAVFLGLAYDTALLNARIDQRVDAMIEEGLVDEVKTLLAKGFRAGLTAHQAIGYKEIVAALEGETSLDYAIERIKIASHRYAKRQRTWLRRDTRIHWLCAESLDSTQLLDQACAELLQ